MATARVAEAAEVSCLQLTNSHLRLYLCCCTLAGLHDFNELLVYLWQERDRG